MKKYISIVFLLIPLMMHAQEPVTWSYTTTKISDKMVEVRMTAVIQSGWHIYSQAQPDNAIATPTSITLNKNPLLSLEGKVKENGQLVKHVDAALDIEAWQYAGKVEFVQQVKFKAKIKTNLSGTIEYQVCTDEKCLPPTTVRFNVSIQ
jgi:hypothetical protein